MGFLDKNGLQRFFDGLKNIFADKNHTHSAMGAATASAAGLAGFVPAPAAGAQAKFLRGDGTWQTPTNTTYSAMKGATASAAGTAGLVPAPTAGKNTSFLRGDGAWAVPTNTTYSAATTSAAGLMSAADKIKMNFTNIAYGTCSTAAATAEKIIEISGNTNWTLQTGAIVVVKFTNTNTASSPTFNVNSTGAKSVWYNTALITTSSLGFAGTANRPMVFTYDGTQYVFIGWSLDSNTTYSNASLGQGYGTCATAEATAAKVVTLSSYALTTGGVVSVKFTYAVPASATLNINSKGAKPIYYKGAAITAGVIKAGDTATFIYNGSQYHLISFDRDTNTTYSAATTSAAGLMSAADKTKLDGVATGATKVTASSTTPKAAGTAAVGTETAYARGDHVHPAQTTVSGNAGTATKWATARNINGMSVQGDANRANYGTCSTAAATVAKTVACTGFALVTGAEIAVKFTVTNTAANPTLNVNSTGAKAIYYRGSAISAGYLAANRTYTFRYNGTQYELVGDIDTNTTYSAMTAATSSAAGKTGLVPAPAAGAQGKFLRGDATWVALDTISTYTHSRSTTGVNNFTGSGANGKAKLTANIQAGDTFQINGTAVTAYVGGDDAASALSGEALSGKWVTFIWDGTQVNFKIGGSLSKTKLQLATADTSHVLAGKTFYSGDKTLKTGAMINLSSSSTITHTSSNGTKVIVGDAVFLATNSDGTNRFEIRYAGSGGYITSNTLFAYPASNLGDAATSNVISGKTFTSANGVKISGVIPNYGYEPTGSSVGWYNPGDQNYVYMYLPNANTDTQSLGGFMTRSIKRPSSDFGNAATSHVLSGKTFTSTAGLRVTGTIATKAAESTTITPASWAQSHTFATSGKYCSGNMTVTVPAVSSAGSAVYAGNAGGTASLPNGAFYNLKDVGSSAAGFSTGSNAWLLVTSQVNSSCVRVQSRVSGKMLVIKNRDGWGTLMDVSNGTSLVGETFTGIAYFIYFPN